MKQTLEPTFPPEICDKIIDSCIDDAHALRTFRLVCRNWMQTARHPLFANVSLYDQPPSTSRVEALTHLLQSDHETISPAIVSFELLVTEPFDHVNKLFKVFGAKDQRLVNLELEFADRGPEASYPSFFNNKHLYTSLVGLSRLELSWSAIAEDDDHLFIAFLAQFPCLAELGLTVSGPGSIDKPPQSFPTLQSASTLRCLAFGGYHGCLLDWFGRQQGLELEILIMKTRLPTNFPEGLPPDSGTRSFLSAQSAFVVTLASSPADLDGRQFPNLVDLQLDFESLHSIDLLPLLRSFDAPKLAGVTLRVRDITLDVSTWVAGVQWAQATELFAAGGSLGSLTVLRVKSNKWDKKFVMLVMRMLNGLAIMSMWDYQWLLAPGNMPEDSLGPLASIVKDMARVAVA